MVSMHEWTLKPGPRPAVSGPVVLVVLDGVGLGPRDAGNAFHLARTPVLDRLMAAGCLPLAAHGKAVGLPSDDDMGNSEVGHNALGAGRVFAQGASLVEQAIESGSIWGSTWQWLTEGGTLHLLGLLSDGNVHSHERHLHAMLQRAAHDGVARVRVHVLLDGRDVPEQSALIYADRLENLLSELSVDGRDYRVASGGGRMLVTMDRYEADWDMVARGWALHVRGEGPRFESLRAAIEAARAAQPGLSDQYLPGFVVSDEAGPVGPIRAGDGVCLFNFRGDRAIEISRAFTEATLAAFERGPLPAVRFAGMMQYDGDLRLPERFLVQPPAIDHTLGEYLARNGVTQFACSETQKFGHVTFFWNGNRSGRFSEDLELYEEVPSDRVSFEERPWMKAAEITDTTLKALNSGRFRHARINYANGDMVGHTGHLGAAILAVEAVDLALGRLLAGVGALQGVALVTADHGNCDEMFQRRKNGTFDREADGRPRVRTSHTLNPVPLCLFDPHGQVHAHLEATVPQPRLANVAATVLELLGFAAPADYEASLLA